MARLDALSLKLANGSTAASLAELYGFVIENYEKMSVSAALKNRELSGDFAAGSVEAKRFLNAVSNAYGTARAAGAGVDVKSSTVTVAKDTHREIIEEIEGFDLNKFGVEGIIQRRALNHVKAMVRETDKAFFAKGYEIGTRVTHSATTWAGKLEEMAVKAESLLNNYVDGVERDLLAFVVTPAVYSALRLEVDEMPAQDNFYAKGAIVMFHEIPVFKSVHLPKESGQVVSAFCMAFASIAQPIEAVPYTAERIPLSKAQAVSLFYDFGTEATAPELVFYSGDAYSAGS